MAEFELHIHNGAFSDLGCRVHFDNEKYGQLVDSLEVSKQSIYRLKTNLMPSRHWNANSLSRLSAAAKGALEPPDSYDPRSHSVVVFASSDSRITNRLLLEGTRAWAGDVNGELDATKELARRDRALHYVEPLAWASGLAIAGAQVGSFEGYAGALGGLMLGKFFALRDNVKYPYNQACRTFAEDPNVLEEYGQIVQYETW